MGMRKTILLLASLALAVMLASGVAWAAAGDLDPTFGGINMRTPGTQADYEHGEIQDVEVLPSGKIVAVSLKELFRYNENGTIDTTFGGGDGTVTLRTYLAALAVRPDGRLLVAGSSDGPDAGTNDDVIVYGFLANGAVDTSFGGGDGRTITTAQAVASVR